jgi:hypothetical protein
VILVASEIVGTHIHPPQNRKPSDTEVRLPLRPLTLDCIQYKQAHFNNLWTHKTDDRFQPPASNDHGYRASFSVASSTSTRSWST